MNIEQRNELLKQAAKVEYEFNLMARVALTLLTHDIESKSRKMSDDEATRMLNAILDETRKLDQEGDNETTN